MSSIDERIVRMKWDDSDFARAAQNTLKLLENVGSAVKSLPGGLSDGIGKLDFSAINDAASKIGDSFTLGGRIALHALDEIATKAIDVGKTVADALVIKPIASGFDEYGLVMDSTQVILSNTGRSLEDVNGALDELNHYADKTIYNFAEMTNAIGRFSAAGVGLEDSIAAIEGLSNMSALVGANAQQNISAMDAVSKALAGGSLKLRQWMQFEAAGSLGGKVFRDELINTAKALGVFDKAWYDATGSSIEGAELLADAQSSFRETLKYGWVTSEVLLQTLAKFSDEESELGQKAAKAATEVRTFKKMWDALQEAAQSSWSQSFEYIFGDYDEGVKLWTTINDEVSRLMAKVNDTRNEMLKFWHDSGGRDALLEGLAILYEKAGRAITPLAAALKSSFSWLGLDGNQRGNILTNASLAFKSWAASLEVSSDRSVKLYNAFKLLEVPIRLVDDFVKTGGLRFLARGFVNVTDALIALGEAFSKALNSTLTSRLLGLGSVYAKFAQAFETVSVHVLNIVTRVGGVMVPLEDGTRTLLSWQSIFANLLTPVRAVVETLKGIDITDLVSIATDAFIILTDIVGYASNVIASFMAKIDTSFLGDLLHQIAGYVTEIREYVSSYEGFQTITGIFEGIGHAAEGLLKVVSSISAIVTKVVEDFVRDGGLVSIVNIVVNLTRAVTNFVNALLDAVRVKFGDDLGGIGMMFSRILKVIEGVTERVLSFSETFDFLGGRVKEAKVVWSSTEKSVNSTANAMDGLKSVIQWLVKQLNDPEKLVNALVERLVVYAQIVSNVIDMAISVINDFVSSGGIQHIIGLFLNWQRVVEDFMAAFVSVVHDAFGGNLAGIGAGLAGLIGVFEDISRVMYNISKQSVFGVVINESGQIAGIAKTMFSWKTILERLMSPLKYIADLIRQIDLRNLTRIGVHGLKSMLAILNAASISLDAFFKSLDTDWLAEAVSDVRKVFKEIRLFFESAEGQDTLVTIFSSALSVAKLFFDVVFQIVGALKSVFKDSDIGEWFTRIGTMFGDFASWLTGIDISPIYDIFSNIANVVLTIGSAITKALEGLFKFEGKTNLISEALKAISSIVEYISKTFFNSSTVQTTLNAVVSFIHLIYEGLSQVFTFVQEFFASDTATKLSDVISRTIGLAVTCIGELIDKLKSFLTEHEVVKTALESLFNFIKPALDGFLDGISYVLDTLEAIHNGSLTWTDAIPEVTGKAIGAIGDKIGWLKEKATGIGEYIGDQFSKMQKPLEENETWFDRFKTNLAAGWERLKDWLSNVGGWLLDALKSALFGHTVSASELTDELAEPIDEISESLPTKILNSITYLWKKIKDVFSGGIENFKMNASDAKAFLDTLVENLSTGIRSGLGTLQHVGSEILNWILNAIFGGNVYDGNVSSGILGNVIEFLDNLINKEIGGRVGEFLSKYETQLAPIRKALSGVIDFVKPIFDELIEIYNASVSSISEFFSDSNGKLNLSSVLDRVGDILGLFGEFNLVSLVGSASKYINSSSKALNKFRKEIPKFSENVNKILDSIGNKEDGLIGRIGKAIQKFPDSINSFLNTTIKGFLDKTITAFDTFINKTMKKSLNRLSKSLDRFMKTADKTIERIGKSIDKAIDNVGKGVKRYMTGKAINEVASGLLKFSIAVGILALALFGLSKIPTEDLKKGGIALAGIMAALLAVVAVIAYVTKDGRKKTTIASEALEGLNGTVIVFGDQVKKALNGFKKALNKFANIGILLTFVFALKTVIDGVKKIGEMKPEQAIVGLIAMAALMVVLSSSMKKILNASKTGAGQSGASLRQVLMMLAMMALIKSAIAGVIKLGGMTWEDMIKGVIAMSVLMGALSLTMKTIYNSTKTMVGEKGAGIGQILELVAVCLAIHTIGNAVVKIGQLDLPNIFLAGVVVAALMGVFGGVIALINYDMSDQGHTLEILAMAAAVWVIGNAVKKIAKLDPAEAGLATLYLGALMGVFAFAVKCAGQATAGIAAIVVISLAVGALVLALTKLSEDMSDSQAARFKKLADSIAEVLLGFAVTLGVCAAVGKLANSAEVTSGLISLVEVSGVMFAAIMVIGGIIAALDQFGNGAGTAALDGLVRFCEKLGDAIGGFIGGIVGNFQEKKASHLEAVGASLTKFAKKAKPFLNLVGDTEKLKGITSGVGDLAGAILKLTAGDILKRLNVFTGGSNDPFSNFATMLESIGPSIASFDSQISGIDAKRVKKAVGALSDLIEAASNIPNQGGMIADIFGDNKLGAFAKGLAKFTPEFGGFIKAMEESDLLGDNAKKVETAIKFANDIAKFADSIPNQGGVIANIFGDNTLKDFAKGLADFTTEFAGFMQAAIDKNLIGDNGEQVQKAIDFAMQLSTFANELPEVHVKEGLDGSVFTESNLIGFADGLTKFTPSFQGFLDMTSKYDYGEDGEEKVKKAIGFARNIVGFVNRLPESKTISLGDISIYTDNALIQFATGMRKFAKSFKLFLDKMIEVDYGTNGAENVDRAIQYANDVATFITGLPDMGFTFKIGDDFVFSTNPLVTLATGLTAFAPSFSTFLETLSGLTLNPVKIATALLFADAAAAIAQKAPKFNGIKDVFTGTTDLDKFGQNLALFAPNFKKYLETLGNATYDASVVEKSNTLMASLTGIAGTVKGSEGVLKAFLFGDDSLTGIGEGLAKFSESMATYSANLESVDFDKAEKANVFIASLADLADKAVSISGFNAFSINDIIATIETQAMTIGPVIADTVEQTTSDVDTENRIKEAANHIGDLITSGIQNGYDDSIGKVKTNIDTSLKEWLDTQKNEIDGKLTTQTNDSADIFFGVVSDNVSSIGSQLESIVYSKAESVMQMGAEAVEAKSGAFYNAGAYAMDGLINGIVSRENEVYNRLQNIANAMAQVMASGLDERSPSHIFEKIGIFVPEGLELGVKKGAPKALEALKKSLIRPFNAMTSLVNDDIEYSPRIRPVVDLDGATESVGRLNEMFGGASISAAGSTIHMVDDNARSRQSVDKIYNDRNVVRAIDGLKGDVVGLNDAIRNMGFYLDGDTFVGGIVDRVDKKLGTNQIRRKRFA